MRDRLEHRHLDHLRVDQDQLNLIRPPRQQDTGNDTVDADTFTRTGCSRDQAVGHGRHIRNQDLTRGAFSQKQRNLHLVCLRGRLFEQVFDPHDFPLTVGHFDADGVLACQWRDDADHSGSQCTGHVVGQGRNLADLNARRQFQFVHRNRRARFGIDHVGIDAEFLKHLLQ